MKFSKKAAAMLALGGGLLATAGIAAALELPDEASSTAVEQVADVDASADAQSKAAEHRQNEDAGGEEADVAEAADVEEGEGEGSRPTDTHGFMVSELATTTELEGRAKGEAISDLARTNGEATSADHAQNDDDGAEDDASANAASEGEHGKSAAARAEHP